MYASRKINHQPIAGIMLTCQLETKFSMKFYMNENVLKMYRKVSNIRRTLVGNKNFYHSDVVGASPVGAAPTTSSFST